MLSTLFELAGFATIVAATYLTAGLVAALYTTGGLLLVVGYAVDDEKAVVSVARAMAPVRRLSFKIRQPLRLRRKLAKAE